MARKFLYLVAGLIVLVIVALFAMRIWQDELTRLAFVPTRAFEPQPALAANAWEDRAMWIARPDVETGNPALFQPDGAAPVAQAPRYFPRSARARLETENLLGRRYRAPDSLAARAQK